MHVFVCTQNRMFSDETNFTKNKTEKQANIGLTNQFCKSNQIKAHHHYHHHGIYRSENIWPIVCFFCGLFCEFYYSPLGIVELNVVAFNDKTRLANVENE